MRQVEILLKFKIILIFLISLFANPQLPAFSADFQQPEYRKIREGIKYGRVRISDPPLLYHVVRVDLIDPEIQVKPVRAKGRTEDIEKMAVRLLQEGKPFLVSINGDYFTPGNKNYFFPWGILVENGDIIFSPTDKSSLLFDEEGRAQIAVPQFTAWVSFSGKEKYKVVAVNRRLETGPGECCLFTRAWDITAPEYEKGMAVKVSTESTIREGVINGKVWGISLMPVRDPIPEKGYVLVFNEISQPSFKKPSLGEMVSLEIDLAPTVFQAIGGGPRLVRDGKISVESSQENFSRSKSAYLNRGRHPRSAVGISLNGKELIMVVVEGRCRESLGLKMWELAQLMLSLGSQEAMSFDGGRSVGLFLDGKQLVKAQRIICNALGVFVREKER